MRRKILIAVVLLTFLPILLIGGFANYYAQSTIQNTKQDMLTGVANLMDYHLTWFYEELLSNIKEKAEMDQFKKLLMAEYSSGIDDNDLSEIKKIILEDVGLPSEGGAIIDSYGKIIISNQPSEEGLMLNKTKMFQSIMTGSDSYLGLLKNADDTQKMEIAVPVFDEKGNVIGIFRQILNLDGLTRYLDNFNIGNIDYTFLIQENGSMVIQNKNKNLALFYNEYQDKNTLEQLAADFKNGRLKKDSGSVEFQIKGTEFVGVYKKVEEINSIAVIAIDRSEMISEMVKVKQIIFTIGFCLLLLAGVIGYILGDFFVGPIKEIINKLRKIADGDLTVRCNYLRNDEYRELSDNINSIAENLQKSERELRMSARIDNMTYLPNRHAIYEVLDTLLYKHPNQALLLLNLDGFGQINDNLGHDIGDRVLMEVGDILRSLPQHVCYSSRIGGDEFLVFITNWTADKYPERIAEKIIKKIESIRFIDEVHVDISVSIGIEYIDGERIDKKKRIKHSDFAMHKAKNTGKNSYLVYYPYLQKEN